MSGNCSPSIRIWKLPEAPPALRALAAGAECEPKWIAQVDAAVAHELDCLLAGRLGASGPVCRYTFAGSVVYIGFQGELFPNSELDRAASSAERT